MNHPNMYHRRGGPSGRHESTGQRHEYWDNSNVEYANDIPVADPHPPSLVDERLNSFAEWSISTP